MKEKKDFSFCEPNTTQRIFTSEDSKGLEANRWSFLFIEKELAEVDKQYMSLQWWQNFFLKNTALFLK